MRPFACAWTGFVPAIKDQPIAVELPPIEKPADSVEAVASIAACRRQADLTAAEAALLAKVVDVYVRTLDTQEGSTSG